MEKVWYRPRLGSWTKREVKGTEEWEKVERCKRWLATLSEANRDFLAQILRGSWLPYDDNVPKWVVQDWIEEMGGERAFHGLLCWDKMGYTKKGKRRKRRIPMP